MGLFKKKLCPICNTEVGLFSISTYSVDGLFLCSICGDIVSNGGLTPEKANGKSLAEIKEAYELGVIAINKRQEKISEQKRENADRISKFNATRTIGTYMQIDEDKHQWTVSSGIFSTKVTNNSSIYLYSDILNYELLEDGATITKGGASIGRAAVGGILFGGVGAVIGGVTGKKKSIPTCTSLKIKITVNDLVNPVVYINLITTETKKSSFIYQTSYQTAQEILSTLDLLTSESDKEKSVSAENAQISVADEIKKFKELLDMGAITQEEFDAKKKDLLGL